MNCLKLTCIYRLLYNGADVNGSPQLVNGDGDGTVNIRSLKACVQWQQSQKQKIYYQGFSGVDHTGILKNDNILAYIKTILKV